jgi:hypothetical protein
VETRPGPRLFSLAEPCNEFKKPLAKPAIWGEKGG